MLNGPNAEDKVHFVKYRTNVDSVSDPFSLLTLHCFILILSVWCHFYFVKFFVTLLNNNLLASLKREG